MQAILDLQKLQAPATEATALGDSCSSSRSNCCNNQQ